MVWTYQEKARRARAKNNVICTSTRKETESKRENQVEWKDSCKRDMENVGLKEEDVLDRTKGR